VAKPKFPKEIFVYLDKRGDDYDIEARQTLKEAAYGLGDGETMQIARYVLANGEPSSYTAKLITFSKPSTRIK